jgi:hypothetical protein
MAGYVLTATYWYRNGETSRCYRRGDVLDDLTADEIENLRRAGAIAKAGDAAGKAAKANPEPTPPQPGSTEPGAYGQASAGLAAANSGLAPDDATGGVLSDKQVAEARAGAERPPKTASVDEWRRWAVVSRKVSADDAAVMSKTDLQAFD